MNRPPRFLIGDKAISGDSVRVTGSELHHLRDVRRLAPGAPVELLNSDGLAYSGRIARFEADAAIIKLEGEVEPVSKVAHIILAAPIIKGPRMDFMVEKAAELGANELWPLETARGVVRVPSAERRDRWRRLASAAAKQSLAAGSMTIGVPLSVAAMTAIVPAGGLAILCDQGGDPLGQIVSWQRPPAILITCGPEGDFDDAEKAKMADAGFVAASLGPNRLRSETAALAALSIVAQALHEQERG